MRNLVSRIRDELRFQSLIAMGRTAPNPAVACVLLGEDADGEPILVGGATEPAGGRHAEIVALDEWNARYPDLAPARLYVTLAPCNHHGRTPPCADRILETESIKRIYVGLDDPISEHSALERLKNQLRLGRRNRELARTFLNGFVLRQTENRPRFHAKLAMTEDGFIGLPDRRLFISGKSALGFGQWLRAKCDAVLVGRRTAMSDSPGLHLRSEQLQALEEIVSLTGKADHFVEGLSKHRSELLDIVRQSEADYQPIRMVPVDETTDPEHFIFQDRITESKGGHWTPLIDGKAATGNRDTIFFSRDPEQFRATLVARGLSDILVEGGAELHRTLKYRRGDRLYLLKSHKTLRELVGVDAQKDAIPAPDFFRELTGTTYRLGASDELIVSEL